MSHPGGAAGMTGAIHGDCRRVVVNYLCGSSSWLVMCGDNLGKFHNLFAWARSLEFGNSALFLIPRLRPFYDILLRRRGVLRG